MTVEIHDVTPAHEAEVHAIHEALAAIGVHRPTLLVVPAFLDDDGKSWDLRDAPAFATWLRDRQAEGTELIQHGLTHRAPGPPPPGIRNAFMHYAFSRG
ncbi:MAG: DUF2334 domain-containing protein, partial [Deltaproteobacteria bacterium]|nr:DUF2334 domain-containing protein [Deltaproteobacteria bacterium]